MVGGRIFHREMIQREISRALVLNLSGKASGAQTLHRTTMPLTEPSLLSRGTLLECKIAVANGLWGCILVCFRMPKWKSWPRPHRRTSALRSLEPREGCEVVGG